MVVLGVSGCAMVNKPSMRVETALGLAGFKAESEVCKEAGQTYSINDSYYERVVSSLLSRFDLDSDMELVFEKEHKRKKGYYEGVDADHLKTVCNGLNDVALKYMNLNYRLKNEHEARKAQASANFNKAMTQISSSLQQTGQQIHATSRAALQSTSQSMPTAPTIYRPQQVVSPPAVRNRMEGLTNPANRLETRSVLTSSSFNQGMYQCEYANGQRRFSYTGCPQFLGG